MQTSGFLQARRQPPAILASQPKFRFFFNEKNLR